MKKNRIAELIIGIINIIFGVGFGIMITSMIGFNPFTIICILAIILGCYLIIGADRFLEFRTANLHEMTSEGVVHSKDKSMHISTYSDSKQSSSQSHNEYLVRVRTPIGFYDSNDKNAYLTYREGDEVKILVRTRYNKKGKVLRQETIILGLLSSLSK